MVSATTWIIETSAICHRQRQPRSESAIRNPQSAICNLPICNLPICNPPICNLPICNPPICNPPICNLPICHLPICNLPICNLPIQKPPISLLFFQSCHLKKYQLSLLKFFEYKMHLKCHK